MNRIRIHLCKSSNTNDIKDLSNILSEITAIKRLLLEDKKVLTVEEFSAYSGHSKSYIYKLCSERKIRYSSPTNGLNFFKKQDVDEFLLSNPIVTKEELNQQASNYLISKSIKGGRNHGI